MVRRVTKGGYILTGEDSASPVIVHYGTPRHSGRYPWGSGKNPQRSRNWLASVRDMEKNHHMSEKEIANACGMTIQELRNRKTIETNEEKNARINQYLKLRDKGMSRNAAASRMGLSESTVRGWENQRTKGRTEIISNVADVLKEQVKNKKYIDIGKGSETMLDISPSRMKAVKQALMDEGYSVQTIWVNQMGTQNKTKITVLAPPNTKATDIYNYIHKDGGTISTITDVKSNDGGRSFLGIKRPEKIDSSRVKVVYAEDGGKDRDGLIQIRRGVEDISLGSSLYAQVRINVDDTHYMKGMAVYGEDKDFPKGVDILYNSNKSRGASKDKVFKPLQRKEDGDVDWDNPFGASIKAGGQRGKLNIVNEEGDWDTWSKTLSSQFLSKQDVSLVKEQLGLTEREYKDRFTDIKNIRNPVVRQKELIDFSEECDRAAEQLKATKLPGQATKVLLPVPSLREGECYAPHLEDGTKVVLVRHPHAGRFELPLLTVNNRNREALAMMKNAKDAIGINQKAAEQLSGADFDGDTALVIPNNNGKVKTEKAVQDLISFDNKEAYRAYEGMAKVGEEDGFRRNMEMGKVSNLITDMTEQNAPIEDIIKADKHSMVVIDAQKHNLNWKQSFEDNDIKLLKIRYQGGVNRGAATVVSRAKGEADIPEVKKWKFATNSVDPVTGEKILVPTGRMIGDYIDKDGKYHPLKPAMTKTTKMRAVKDARELLTDKSNDVDKEYARFANAMKGMGNETRLEALKVKAYTLDRNAARVYADEIISLNHKLALATANKPKERQAQLYANMVYKIKLDENPAADDDLKSKWRRQALNEGRTRMGVNGKESRIHFTAKEWEAIDAHALTANKVRELIANADTDNYKSFAMPRNESKVSQTKIARIRALSKRDYSLAEIAQACNVSVSTVTKYIA